MTQIEDLEPADEQILPLGARMWMSVGRLLAIGLGALIGVSVLLAMNAVQPPTPETRVPPGLPVLPQERAVLNALRAGGVTVRTVGASVTETLLRTKVPARAFIAAPGAAGADVLFLPDGFGEIEACSRSASTPGWRDDLLFRNGQVAASLESGRTAYYLVGHNYLAIAYDSATRDALEAHLGLTVAPAPAGCITAQPYASQIPFATASPGDVTALLARPVYLPPIAPGAACPVTYSSDPSLGLSNARGGPHLFLGGPSPKGGEPFNEMGFVIRGATGPIVLRGLRVDAAGAGRLEFSGEMADPLGRVTVTAPTGQYTFYSGVVVRQSPDAFYVYPSTPGCYAIQVDGPDFQDVVVLDAN